MSYQVSVDVQVPMRDGTKLATNLWLPDVPGPVPALLVRTPYGKDLTDVNGVGAPNISKLMKHGYAVALQDCRGTFASEGTFVPHAADADDGADTVRWLTEQDWCDGNVGSYGASYLGFVQWQTASTGVPALKVMSTTVTSADPYRAPWHSRGGALALGAVLRWAVMMSLNEARRAGASEDVMQLALKVANFADLDTVTPLTDHPLIAKYLPWMIDGNIGQPDRDEYWTELSALERVSSISTAVLHIGGWYDIFYGETLRAYAQMKAHAATEDARTGQRLIIGPWSHNPSGFLGYYPDRNFGAAAGMQAAMLTAPQIALFDRWLKGREHALDRFAPVRIFVMGIDQWRDEQDWPLPDTTYTDYYLGGDGPANTASGAGSLSANGAGTGATDTYLYDPRRPVPSLGGTLMNMGGYEGAADQRPLHDRADILFFTSEVLTEPVEVTGPVSATLFVSSSAVDTDFTVKLVDVFPDGRAIILCDGIQRMRYRDSLSDPRPMTPGEIYEIAVDLIATSNVFLPGHRIMVEVSSSNFPHYDRNSNTGGVIADERESDMVVAVNQIYRGAAHPSRITLPIINR